AKYKIVVHWVASADAAVNLCNQTPMSAVLINTSTPGVDPYRLCQAIKNSNAETKTAVVFLNGANFQHDSALARQAGFDGLLDKPVSGPILMAALRKFLSIG
ncbi:MAG TPA: response regulator, partial [Burkholderiaceae bacterium]